MVARALLVGGTASHVGKSYVTTAICRHLRRKGFRVAPFKAQNMSNNSYPCRGGGEIGRAQVAQAEACGLEPEPDMNPVLLKPNSDVGSQVVVDGQVWRNLSAREYYEHFPYLRQRVLDAYARLSARFDYIVMEGAGSIVELNLKERDLVNLGMAQAVGAPVLLVADIDRGGVFASLVGTFTLLTADETKLVRSYAVNRFRGDPSLFSSGVDILTERTQKPCLGVLPYLHSQIDEEDGVSLQERRPTSAQSRVAIVQLPHISNFTDFALLPDARYLTRPVDETFDAILLPGTKNTLGDLTWLRSTGLADWIVRQHRSGTQIIGVCGGYQILGESISDPLAIESEIGSAPGLGLLPVQTVLASEKTTRVVRAQTPSGTSFSAYEIHVGQTTVPIGSTPFARTEHGPDGVRVGHCCGTYLHDALRDAGVLSELLNQPIAPAPTRDAAYDALADWWERHADLKLFAELYL